MLTVLRGCGTSWLLPVVMLLSMWGLVSLFSASAGLGTEPGSRQWDLLARQLGGFAVGLIGAAALAVCPPGLLRRLGYVAWAGSTLALWATLGPLGVSGNHAQRWLALGPVTLQPLEFAKVGLVLGLASWLSANAARVHDVRFGLLAPAVAIGVPAGALVLQPDFSGAMLLLAFGGVMVWVAGARTSHLAAASCLVLPAAAIIGSTASYRMERIWSWLRPFDYAQDEGYQLVQSMLAVGAGGWWGKGLGQSDAKWKFLPEPHTDFLLSVVGEELGLIGIGALLLGFAILGLASLGIATRARDLHGQLLAVGAGALLWLQAALNAGVALGMIPTTGTTLPLFSYGRSSVVASLAALGLILHVARPRTAAQEGWR